MLKFLATYKSRLNKWSTIDLGCSYGWFVAEFAKRGCSEAVGVDIDPASLKIGKIAYGLGPEQLVSSDLQIFLSDCSRTYDIVLVLSVLHYFALNSGLETVKNLLKRIDALTGFVLFIDTGQAHEHWFCDSLSMWDNEFIIRLIKEHTSFDIVFLLGADSDKVAPFSDNYGRTLFVCVRS